MLHTSSSILSHHVVLFSYPEFLPTVLFSVPGAYLGCDILSKHLRLEVFDNLLGLVFDDLENF